MQTRTSHRLKQKNAVQWLSLPNREMKAKAQEARAKVIEAEAEVPKAMAEAFRSGNLGIMDYYRM